MYSAKYRDSVTLEYYLRKKEKSKLKSWHFHQVYKQKLRQRRQAIYLQTI